MIRTLSMLLSAALLVTAWQGSGNLIHSAYAQGSNAELSDFTNNIPLLYLWGMNNPDEYTRPRAGEEADQAVLNYRGPKEPVMPKVEFHAFDQPQHLQGRVESLVHGIRINLPAEYDHYGYEMRRYMNTVGNIDIYQNRYAIEDQIVNVQKARVVFEYWRDKLVAEMDAIEAAIAADPETSAKVKTSFDVNQRIVKAFIIEAQSWVSANERLLTFLADNRKEYTFEKGRFVFRSAPLFQKFVALFTVRERAKLQLKQNYPPFSKIVY